MWALYVFLAILLLPTAAVVAVYASRIRFSRRIVARTVPAQSSPKDCRRTIVVAGDSTAFGVGALPAESTAGRLAAARDHSARAAADLPLRRRSHRMAAAHCRPPP